MILGGTTEATTLSARLAALGVPATVSLAGRVARPQPLPLPMRIGGFGGREGLRDFLTEAQITHVIDATHPFASQMSHTAESVCSALRIPLLGLSRLAWAAQPADRWHHVPDMAGAVAALDGPAARVMLAIGRMHLKDFARQPEHHYLLRLVDPTTEPLPLPCATTVIDRGPFTFENDLALLRDHKIDVVVSKNAGGTGAVAKIDAARRLGLRVIMVDRPKPPNRPEVTSVDAVLDWLRSHDADLGV